MKRQKRKEPLASKVLCVLLLGCVITALNFGFAWSDGDELPRTELFHLKAMGFITLGYFLLYAIAILCMDAFRRHRKLR